MNLNKKVLEWAEEKGLMETGTVMGQMGKLDEEYKELMAAILHEDMPEVEDAIGDMQVVLIILAAIMGLDARECLEKAYGVISKRTGKMVNGVFVKDE